MEIDAELPRVPINLVYHREIRRATRVRLVVDALLDYSREGLR